MVKTKHSFQILFFFFLSFVFIDNIIFPMNGILNGSNQSVPPCLLIWFHIKMMMLLEIEKHLGPSWLRRPSVGCNCYWWQKMITCNLILCTTGTPPAHLWPRWRGPDRPWRQSELRGETSWDHTGPDRERGVTGSGEVTASHHRPHAATG